MALTELQILKIKNWAQGIYDYLETADPDTTPDRIKLNRAKMLLAKTEMPYVKALKAGLTAGQGNFLENLIYLFGEWVHYFDTGYRSPENIDDLADKLKTALAKVITAEI